MDARRYHDTIPPIQPMSEAIDISFIIVTYNSRKHLFPCLRSLASCVSKFTFEVVIIDNSPVFDYEDISTHFKGLNLHIYFPGQNLGFAKANNLGAKHSKGLYLWILNPDVIVQEGFDEEAIRCIRSAQNQAIVGSRLLNPDGTIQKSIFRNVGLVNETVRLSGISKAIGTNSKCLQRSSSSLKHDVEPSEAEIIMGASILLPRSIYEKVGLFDERLFMYQEEVDLCYNVKGHGFSVLYCPSSRIIHTGGHSTGLLGSNQFIHRTRSMLIIYSKYFSALESIFYRSLVASTSLFKILSLPFRRAATDLHISAGPSKVKSTSRKEAASAYWKTFILAISYWPHIAR